MCHSTLTERESIIQRRCQKFHNPIFSWMATRKTFWKLPDTEKYFGCILWLIFWEALLTYLYKYTNKHWKQFPCLKRHNFTLHILIHKISSKIVVKLERNTTRNDVKLCTSETQMIVFKFCIFILQILWTSPKISKFAGLEADIIEYNS